MSSLYELQRKPPSHAQAQVCHTNLLAGNKNKDKERAALAWKVKIDQPKKSLALNRTTEGLAVGRSGFRIPSMKNKIKHTSLEFSNSGMVFHLFCKSAKQTFTSDQTNFSACPPTVQKSEKPNLNPGIPMKYVFCLFSRAFSETLLAGCRFHLNEQNQEVAPTIH